MQETIKPFGKALYLRKAPYRVLPLFFFSLWNHTTELWISVFWMTPVVLTLQVRAVLLWAGVFLCLVSRRMRWVALSNSACAHTVEPLALRRS